ncbi:hypothetical protein TREES_T100012121 [Tupaia chinensis]|uniref:Uncharacterized protein n=1 Tax=Tupaia chinensis TaxID=246437 RepID=L9K002_TUPCH|nr:hypothetical protein TREES_T100012121 [Tupaia chinensis]
MKPHLITVIFPTLVSWQKEVGPSLPMAPRGSNFRVGITRGSDAGQGRGWREEQRVGAEPARTAHPCSCHDSSKHSPDHSENEESGSRSPHAGKPLLPRSDLELITHTSSTRLGTTEQDGFHGLPTELSEGSRRAGPGLCGVTCRTTFAPHLRRLAALWEALGVRARELAVESHDHSDRRGLQGSAMKLNNRKTHNDRDSHVQTFLPGDQ